MRIDMYLFLRWILNTTSSAEESVRLEARFQGEKHEWRISPMKTLDFAAVCKWNVLLKSAGGSKGIGVVTQHCNEIVHYFSQIQNCSSF